MKNIKLRFYVHRSLWEPLSVWVQPRNVYSDRDNVQNGYLFISSNFALTETGSQPVKSSLKRTVIIAKKTVTEKSTDADKIYPNFLVAIPEANN